MKVFSNVAVVLLISLGGLVKPAQAQSTKPKMMFGDTDHRPGGYAKDPHVVWFGNRYLPIRFFQICLRYSFYFAGGKTDGQV
ncbi:MAG: hypothetical protein EOO39_37480, partial [Cytophagaceae bacterium]